MNLYQIVEFVKSCLCSSVTGFSEGVQKFGDFHGEIKEHQKKI